MFDWLRRRRTGPGVDTPPDTDDSLPVMDGGPFFIRPMEAADAELLPRIFRAAIHGQGAAFYTPAQRKAWASSADDAAAFVASLEQGVTIVADLDGRAGGFAQLHPENTLHMMYVAPGLAGYGVATLLCQYLEDEARILGQDVLHTHASLAAKRFFEQMGFNVDAEETVTRAGVTIPRFSMTKILRKL